MASAWLFAVPSRFMAFANGIGSMATITMIRNSALPRIGLTACSLILRSRSCQRRWPSPNRGMGAAICGWHETLTLKWKRKSWNENRGSDESPPLVKLISLDRDDGRIRRCGGGEIVRPGPGAALRTLGIEDSEAASFRENGRVSVSRSWTKRVHGRSSGAVRSAGDDCARSFRSQSCRGGRRLR